MITNLSEDHKHSDILLLWPLDSQNLSLILRKQYLKLHGKVKLNLTNKAQKKLDEGRKTSINNYISFIDSSDNYICVTFSDDYFKNSERFCLEIEEEPIIKNIIFQLFTSWQLPWQFWHHFLVDSFPLKATNKITRCFHLWLTHYLIAYTF